MAQGERLHLSYERMALLVGGAPAFVADADRTPNILKRIQTISYSFDFGSQQLKELGSLEYIKDRTPSGSRIPVISQPTVNLQFEYLFLDTKNEENMGFGIGEDSIFKNSFVEYQKTKLSAGKIIVDWNTNILDAIHINNEYPSVKTKGDDPMVGNSMVYDLVAKHGRIQQGRTTYNQSFYHLDYLIDKISNQ